MASFSSLIFHQLLCHISLLPPFLPAPTHVLLTPPHDFCRPRDGIPGLGPTLNKAEIIQAFLLSNPFAILNPIRPPHPLSLSFPTLLCLDLRFPKIAGSFSTENFASPKLHRMPLSTTKLCPQSHCQILALGLTERAKTTE